MLSAHCWSVPNVIRRTAARTHCADTCDSSVGRSLGSVVHIVPTAPSSDTTSCYTSAEPTEKSCHRPQCHWTNRLNGGGSSHIDLNKTFVATHQVDEQTFKVTDNRPYHGKYQ
uniref:Uncharacterized protein n=1 Tax=Cuerna arida TaxID=1464854 RepID=A0A1B6FVD4_9HEMI